MNKKIFSILLSMILMVSMLAMPVFAEPTDGGDGEAKETIETTDGGSGQVTVTETPEENSTTDGEDSSTNGDSNKQEPGTEGTVGGGTDGTETVPSDGEQGSEQSAHVTAKKSYNIRLSIDESLLSTDPVYTGDNAVTVDINRGVEKRVPLKVEVTEAAEEKVSDKDASETGEVSEEETLTATEEEPVVNNEEKSSESEEPVVVPEVPEVVVTSNSDAVTIESNEDGYWLILKAATEVTPAEITAAIAASDTCNATETAIYVNVEEWIPSLKEPTAATGKTAETVVCREGREANLMILEKNLEDLDENDLEAIKSGKLEIWQGYKYKKADNNITTSIDESINENEDGRYVVKFGSKEKDLEIKATGDVSSTSDNVAVEVTDGIISVINKVSDIVKITIEAAGDEFTKAAKRTIDVEVVKGDQVITVSKASYSLPFGYKKFNLGAKSNASGAELKYSSNNAAVGVDSVGNVTIRNVTGSRAAVITIRSDATDRYNAAPDRTVSITVTSPSAPSLTAKAIGKRKVQLSWSGVTGAVSYQIQPYLGKKTLKAKTVTSTSIKNTKLKKRKTYKYKVRAVVTANGRTIYGPWSTLRSVKVK